jgi:cytochrome P450
VISPCFNEAANDPALLPAVRVHPDLAVSAVEEIVRLTTPLTAISRTCPHDTDWQEAGGRIGLCWASANREEPFFPNPDTFQADRNPNPHIGFGFCPHNCLGATHARLLLRTLFRVLAEEEIRLRILEEEPQSEHFGGITRSTGFRNLRVRMQNQTSF